MTYPHHDAEGAATFAIVQSGVKNWVVFKVEDTTRDQLPDFLTQVSSDKSCLDRYKDRLKAETIHLYTGDLL